MKATTVLSFPLLGAVACAASKTGPNAGVENHVEIDSPAAVGGRRVAKSSLRARREQYTGSDFIVTLLDSNDVPIITATEAPQSESSAASDATSTSESTASNNSSSNGSANSQSFFSSKMGCSSDQRKVKMEIRVDRYGSETTWLLERVEGNGSRTTVMSNSRTYSGNDSETQEMCLDVGQYELVLLDDIGDGICCQYDEGYYHFSLEREDGWDTVIRGGSFKEKRFTHSIQIRVVDPPLSSRDEQWLIAHNTRRQYWHNYYNTQYIPLRWSTELAESSRIYAETLLDDCDDGGIVHDPNNYYGENMAKNKGTGGWGEEYHPDQLVGRFVDREVGLDWPDNAHLTQALWRGSKYVGCADASKPWNGGTCRTQVCRYSKVGNCAMSHGNDWQEKMLEDDSPCYPECPPEGCF